MPSLTSILALTLALPAVITGTQYGLVKEYAGEHFFDDWDFYGHCEFADFGRRPLSLPLKLCMLQTTTSLTATPSTC